MSLGSQGMLEARFLAANSLIQVYGCRAPELQRQFAQAGNKRAAFRMRWCPFRRHSQQQSQQNQTLQD